MKNAISKTRLLLRLMVAVASLAATAHAAAPGITGTGRFNLDGAAGFPEPAGWASGLLVGLRL